MKTHAFALCFAALALAGCDQPIGSGYAETGQVSQNQITLYGTVVGVRTVRLQDGSGNQVAGAVVGGIAGAVVGNQFGQGSGNTLMTGAGAVGGAMLGSRLAQGSSGRLAQQWTVRLDSGGRIDVIQETGQFRIGERVRVMRTANGTYLAS